MSLARATAVMTVGTVLSRITGLLRIAAIVAALGVAEDRLADTYNLGNTVPNIIYELILGGILTSVFVPVFVQLLEKEGKEKAWVIASSIINISLIILTAMTVVGMFAAPVIAHIYTSGVPEAQAAVQRDVLTFLIRLFIPQIIFYGLAALTAGLLNANKKFAAPMYTPVLNNLAVIVIFIAFHQAYGDVGGLAGATRWQLVIIGGGTTLGVALMAIAQLPFLRGLGRYRFTLSGVKHPAVKNLARLSVFVIGYVIVNQIGYLIVQVLAASNQGDFAAYITAFTFFMLPHGLFAVSIITALLPGMSELAVDERWDEFRLRLSTGIRTTALLIFPAAVGYLVLGEPIVRFMLQRGVMTAESTELVAGVLRLFVIGLLPFSLFQLFLRAFYSMQNTKTPFLINCAAVALNTAVNLTVYDRFGVRGLAAGHAIAYTFGVFLQARSLSKRIGGLDGAAIVRSVGRIAIAAGGMGLLVWLSSRALDGVLGSTFVGQTVGLAVPVLVGVVSYLVLSRLLHVPELDYAKGLLTRRTVRRG